MHRPVQRKYAAKAAHGEYRKINALYYQNFCKKYVQ